MTEAQSTNTHEVITELFRAMNTPPDERHAAKIKSWADVFPYVNGGLFSNDIDCPRFSKIARSYLLRVGELNWKEINPDIFGSMIQAVADDVERGSLGMHYTSVPNILKVFDPLFLDDLRQKLQEAADNPRKLLNLRKRIAAIRVFDPAYGSGNFLVIAYIEMRKIEAEIDAVNRAQRLGCAGTIASKPEPALIVLGSDRQSECRELAVRLLVADGQKPSFAMWHQGNLMRLRRRPARSAA